VMSLALGPTAIDITERKRLLLDRASVLALHRGVWALADPERARLWGRPGLGPTEPEPTR
jgi:hypothetical protein